MNTKILISVLLTILFAASCSSTPGDAARRGGNSEAAAELYLKGSELGDNAAALKLGLMISEGLVPHEKFGDAIKWYKLACDLGNNTGCHNSGNSYEYGKVGALLDYEQARIYYLRAARNGYMQSQYNLGSMYANQYFNNDVEGLKWMLVARNTASNCSKVPLCQWVTNDPPKHVKKLTGRMSAGQISKARLQANDWKTE